MLLLLTEISLLPFLGCARWRTWLRHCATSREAAGSISDVLIGIFNSECAMTLVSPQPLTETITRNICCGVKAAGALLWQRCHRHVPVVQKFWEPQTPEALRVCRSLKGDSFTFPHFLCFKSKYREETTYEVKYRHWWEDNIKIGIIETMWPCGLDSSVLEQCLLKFFCE